MSCSTRMKVIISGLYPEEDWKNDKGHISALTKGGKIVCYGAGSLAGVPNGTPFGLSCHSEMTVIKKLGNKQVKDYSKYILWNIRWDKNGNIRESKPCKQCQITLLKLGIKTVVYSKQDGTFVKEKLKDMKCYHTRSIREPICKKCK